MFQLRIRGAGLKELFTDLEHWLGTKSIVPVGTLYTVYRYVIISLLVQSTVLYKMF
jgi:hypothetical protein